MKNFHLHILFILIFLNCSGNTKRDLNTAQHLLNQGKIIQAYNRFKENSEDDLQLFNEKLLQANIYAATCFECPDSLPSTIDSLIEMTSIHYHQLFSDTSLKNRALLNYSIFCYHQGWFDSCSYYLTKLTEIDSINTGCTSYFLSSYINTNDWSRSNSVGEMFFKINPISGKWYLLESLKNISSPESGLIIVLNDDSKATDQHGSTKSFKKYDILEYKGCDLNTYHVKNNKIGWIPEDMRWFRGIFEKADYSLEGNIYTLPSGGRRIRKDIIKSGSVRRLSGRAESTSGLGIVRSGWYQVEFECTTPLTIPKSKVIPCIGSIYEEENRILKLKNLSFLNEDFKQRLLESLIFHKMPLSLFEISLPYAHISEFIPTQDKVKVTYQYDDSYFILENGYLIDWFTMKK
ncbi:MAG: hypothetical protein ACTSYF_14545 [Promethearchaeota archaeon]